MLGQLCNAWNQRAHRQAMRASKCWISAEVCLPIKSRDIQFANVHTIPQIQAGLITFERAGIDAALSLQSRLAPSLRQGVIVDGIRRRTWRGTLPAAGISVPAAGARTICAPLRCAPGQRTTPRRLRRRQQQQHQPQRQQQQQQQQQPWM